MREDLHTPNTRAAATWQRHHAPDSTPSAERITAADVAPMAHPDPPCTCGHPKCIACAYRRALAATRRTA